MASESILFLQHHDQTFCGDPNMELEASFDYCAGSTSSDPSFSGIQNKNSYMNNPRAYNDSHGVAEVPDGRFFVAAAAEEKDEENDDDVRAGSKICSATHRWSGQETVDLLKIRAEMDSVFQQNNFKDIWEEVARMEQLGYHRSAKKCKEKFHNVSKYYKRTRKDPRNSKSKNHDFIAHNNYCMKDFMERMLIQVTQKLEAMQSRLLEELQRMEEARAVREEARLRQNIGKLAYEQQRQLEHQALDATKDAAFLTFIKNLRGCPVEGSLGYSGFHSSMDLRDRKRKMIMNIMMMMKKKKMKEQQEAKG